jgi:nucleoside-diphosphate-sugar epimerase
MNDPILVTGATGFIGSYLLPLLQETGAQVRVLVRNPALLNPAIRPSLDVHVGDIRDRKVVGRAIQGAETVLHLAACARAWMRERDAYRSINVEAVHGLLDACERSDVQRLVHVSTILTLPPYRAAEHVGSASRPTPYEKTKREGEELVEAYAHAGHHAVIVHPTRVFGPGPLTDANAVSRAASLYLQGMLRVRLADGGALSNWVYVGDVAAGILLATQRGRSGAHYVLGGDNASFEEFLDLVSELGGVRRQVVPLPARLALGVAGMAEVWGRLGGIAPITRRFVRAFLEDRRADLTPARQDLGYRPRSLREGLATTVAWLQSQDGRAAA